MVLTISINLPLLIWLSPSFPVGAFAYSHGLEQAQECGAVTNLTELKTWLLCLLQDGSLKSDLALLKATLEGEDVNALALALAPSQERLLETSQQGNAFVKNIKAAWLHDDFTPPKGDVAYCVAVGLAARSYGFEPQEVLTCYALAFISNLTSASIRLGIIGQTQGQILLQELQQPIQTAVEFALNNDDFGTSCFYADFVSLKHETQYTRIFRS